jgi:SWI/SNF-related matrix-associated actin-dependent regulator of chromatin subfamily A protein 2/4
MPSDPNTYVAAISRHAAARMHQMHSRMQQEAELKRRRELHARMAAARLREDKKRMEAERRAQAEISRKQRLAMSLARKKEIDGRVAVVRERRVWLAQMFAHAKALEKAEKDSKHRLRKRNNGVLSYHRKQQNAEAREERARIEALKAGDEEAYLRLVQDSKDQRIEELLSTTDDLLKHLAEKIDATKAAARRAMEDPDVLDPDAPPEDDVTDEAGTPRGKEKYSAIRQFTKLAHSADVEEIVVQPSILIGPNGAGAMRSYQLAGLQWMVSLYNNQLNGILADEMGLGKTIQCISLLAYLAENKGVKGPHLILAPKAVLPNWAREFKIWYPDCDVVMYDGYKDARRRCARIVINEGAFDVLLTHYDLGHVRQDVAEQNRVELHRGGRRAQAEEPPVQAQHRTPGGVHRLAPPVTDGHAHPEQPHGALGFTKLSPPVRVQLNRRLRGLVQRAFRGEQRGRGAERGRGAFDHPAPAPGPTAVLTAT